MKLSYSDYRTYLDCPRLYKLRRDRVEPPEKENKYFALYGLLIERFFRKYTNEVCKKGIQLTDDQVREALGEMWKNVLSENYVNWDEPWVKLTSNQIFEMVCADTLENLRKFTFWKDSRSEVSFNVRLKKSGDLITCRMDFVHEPPGGPVEIIDGKGKTKIETDIDLDQLYFYALVYLLNKRRLPDKIGFLYYRFKIIKYIDFDNAAIMSFRDKFVIVKESMKKDTEFAPKVALSKQCRWCAYKMSCDAYLSKKQESNGKKNPIVQAGGYQDVSF